MFNHKEIEKKWQEFWEENKIYKCESPNVETSIYGVSDQDTINRVSTNKPKCYTLIEFPYPSWVWLHVWHVKWQTAVDIYARYKRMNGYNVLNCMWWDAFWLPAENFAIKNKAHPWVFTSENIKTFKKQIKSFGPSFDWDREIDTTDPKYYKWTQWIFLELFKAWLAYEKKAPINWCPSCSTGLANEEVIDGHCERCDSIVEQKLMKQWFLAITKYADRLESDLSDLNWPEYIKTSQKNWIGKSEGCEFEMKVADTPPSIPPLPGEGSNSEILSPGRGKMSEGQIGVIKVFTTRIDTVFGMTYAVLAPDHPQVLEFITENEKKSCLDYIETAKKKSAMERTELNKDKTWVFTGSYVINPYNNEKVPLWIADYVLWNYWTWAVMAVPAHDERDFEFAKKYGLEIKQSIATIHHVPDGKEEDWIYDYKNLDKLHKICTDYSENWTLINSWDFTWLNSIEAFEKLTEFATQNWFWKKVSNYKLRDWLFSRQRYRWEPIPLIHLQIEDLKKLPHITDLSQAKFPNLAYILKRNPNSGENCDRVKCGCGHVRELVIWGKVFSKIYDSIDSKLVVDERLPLELPEVENYEPSWDWQSPLAKIDSFVNVKLADNLTWKRETNTMPQWAWSSWYFLRYLDPHNDKEFASKENLKYFMPVDVYFGWAEHTTVHLLYSRFWNKALYDLWIVPVSEPYKRRVQHGLIMWEDGRKMSKRWGNVINPDDVIEKYWADTMRAYIMFMGPYGDSVPWSANAIAWVNRFINKVYTLWEKIIDKDSEETLKLLHKTIKKVWFDIENISYHTAISALMIFVNSVWNNGISRESLKIFLQLLSPFAPFITEEMWNKINVETLQCNISTNSIHLSSWPKYDENLVKDDVVVIWVQVLWKLRWEIEINVAESKEDIISKAKEVESVKKWLDWKEIVKEIYVPGKIVNIVVK